MSQSRSSLPASVLVVAYAPVGERMVGPAIRSWEIASALARRGVPVTVTSPEPIGRSAPGVRAESFRDEESLARLCAEADVLLVQGSALRDHPLLQRFGGLLVVDLYDPLLFENLEHEKDRPDEPADERIRSDVEMLNHQMDTGDTFLCASERQRDYWLGMLTARGRIDRRVYAADQSLRLLVDVVPYGCPALPPRREPVLKGVVDGIGADDLVVVWSGGAWSWFDPLAALDAFAAVAPAAPRARLVFVGVQPESPVADSSRENALALGEAVGARGLHDVVRFVPWLPYDHRGAAFAEADVAVLATRDIVEARLAFRSRVVDHFWAGLPTVATGGDVLADLVNEAGAGICVPPGDPDALRAALGRILGDAGLRHRCAQAASGLADRYRWDDVVAPLVAMVRDPHRWRAAVGRHGRDAPAPDAVPEEEAPWSPPPPRGTVRRIARRLDETPLGPAVHSARVFAGRLRRTRDAWRRPRPGAS